MRLNSSWLKAGIASALVMGSALIAFSQSSHAMEMEQVVKDYHLLSFRAAPMLAWDQSGNSFSGLIDWNPYYVINREIAVHFNLGATILNKSVGGSFLLLEENLLGAYKFDRKFSAEAGIGLQNWMSYGGTYFAFMANGVYHLNPKVWNVIDRVFVGYTGVLITNFFTSQIRAGVGVNF